MTFQPFQRQVSTSITSAAAGNELLSYLVARFPYHDREYWQEQILTGRVRCNDLSADARQILQLGDVVAYFPEPRPEPPVDFSAQLLYQDEEILVLAKSANLPCHPAGCFFNHTLWAMLACPRRDDLPEPFCHLPALPKPHFINRLDRETSGVVIIAKNQLAARQVNRRWQATAGGKQYLVVVENGDNFPASLPADGWLGVDPDSKVRKKRRYMVVKPTEQPVEQAATDFQCLAKHERLALLSATLHTGRTHQIRATLCSLGFPVVGDKIYGVDETAYLRFIAGQLSPFDHARLRLPSQALHAWSMEVPLNDGKNMTVTAPIPAFWQQNHNVAQLLENAGICHP